MKEPTLQEQPGVDFHKNRALEVAYSEEIVSLRIKEKGARYENGTYTSVRRSPRTYRFQLAFDTR
jgi:hypothetical protein